MFRYRMPMPTIEHDKSNMTTLCLDRFVWHLAAPRSWSVPGQTISTYRHVLKSKTVFEPTYLRSASRNGYSFSNMLICCEINMHICVSYHTFIASMKASWTYNLVFLVARSWELAMFVRYIVFEPTGFRCARWNGYSFSTPKNWDRKYIVTGP
jgi:hypothetical protein